MRKCGDYLTLEALTPQNGQTHSADEFLSVFDHSVGLALKGLKDIQENIKNT